MRNETKSRKENRDHGRFTEDSPEGSAKDPRTPSNWGRTGPRNDQRNFTEGSRKDHGSFTEGDTSNMIRGPVVDAAFVVQNVIQRSPITPALVDKSERDMIHLSEPYHTYTWCERERKSPFQELRISRRERCRSWTSKSRKENPRHGSFTEDSPEGGE